MDIRNLDGFICKSHYIAMENNHWSSRKYKNITTRMSEIMRFNKIGILAMLCLLAGYKGISFDAKPQEGQCGKDPGMRRIVKSGFNAGFYDLDRWVHLQGVYTINGQSQLRISYIADDSKPDHVHIKAAYSLNHGAQWTLLDSLDSRYTNVPNLNEYYDSGVSSVADSNVLYRPGNKEDSEYEVSKDGGLTWEKISWKFENARNIGSNSTRIVATGTKSAGRMYLKVLEQHRYALYVTDDYGKSFRFLTDSVISVSESRSDPNTLYGIQNKDYRTALCKSIDAGKSWKSIDHGGIFAPIYYDSKSRNMVIGISDKPVHINAISRHNPEAYQIETDPQNPDVFYVLANNGLFKSVNGGISFALLPLESDFYMQIDRIAVDPNRPGRIYAGSGQNSIWMSENGGCSWKKLPLPDFSKWKGR
jgi:hypothetical protein